MTSGGRPSRRLVARTDGTVTGADRGSGMGILLIEPSSAQGLPAAWAVDRPPRSTAYCHPSLSAGPEQGEGRDAGAPAGWPVRPPPTGTGRYRSGRCRRGRAPLGGRPGDRRGHHGPPGRSRSTPRPGCLRGQPAQGRGAGEDHDAEHRHPAVPDGVGQPAAEGEEGGQGEQVGVDRPLDPGGGETQLLWISGTAMDTMVWSMKVIATAKTIAARIRFFDWPRTVPVLATMFLHDESSLRSRPGSTGHCAVVVPSDRGTGGAPGPTVGP